MSTFFKIQARKLKYFRLNLHSGQNFQKFSTGVELLQQTFRKNWDKIFATSNLNEYVSVSLNQISKLRQWAMLPYDFQMGDQAISAAMGDQSISQLDPGSRSVLDRLIAWWAQAQLRPIHFSRHCSNLFDNTYTWNKLILIKSRIGTIEQNLPH